jgi:tetratricopeptide (TPR) repeat protein
MGTSTMQYERACFVIMPFGKKQVGDREVDFDFIYREIFEPAVRATKLADGETASLEPRRTDQEFFSSSIDLEMFRYLEYSRFALADISGLNANVLYELGVRHRANPAGTAIFRQSGTVIPFDIKMIKAFEYLYEPVDEVPQSRALIARVLSESLRFNRPDSPVQLALSVQLAHADQTGGAPVLDEILRAAENALRADNKAEAIRRYREALRLAPDHLATRMKLGIVLKDTGQLTEALAQFCTATDLRNDYAEAWRERGIAENRLFWRGVRLAGAETGEGSLREAVRLSPEDYDALASLGGLLKREGLHRDALGQPDEAIALYESALGFYRKAIAVSQGHPYPLLNALKLQGRLEGEFELDTKVRVYLKRAERARRAEAAMKPPYDVPWCFFDLAEIALYQGDQAGFKVNLEEGLSYCIGNPDRPRSFRESLELLERGGISFDGLRDGLQALKEAESLVAD